MHEDAPVPPGETVGERRVAAMTAGSEADCVRELLCSEPRGHADMYGGFIVPPDDAGPTSVCCSGTRTASRRPVGTARLRLECGRPTLVSSRVIPMA
nr:proline racemase family protein [Leucobacter coleopterorum]